MIPPPIAYDPSRPVLPIALSRSGRTVASRHNQRLRRAQILAAIRQLLVAHGGDGVTMRRIAAHSGHAVQTIYNLVGPRDEAIVQAVSEYTRYVGRSAGSDPDNPQALIRLLECWVVAIAAAPEFCRAVSLMLFTGSRGIFYDIRDSQAKGMHGFLLRQQKCGVLRGDIDMRDLAEQLVIFASGQCAEWADRSLPLEQLCRRLSSGFTNLLAGTLAPGVRNRATGKAGES